MKPTYVILDSNATDDAMEQTVTKTKTRKWEVRFPADIAAHLCPKDVAHFAFQSL